MNILIGFFVYCILCGIVTKIHYLIQEPYSDSVLIGMFWPATLPFMVGVFIVKYIMIFWKKSLKLNKLFEKKGK